MCKRCTAYRTCWGEHRAETEDAVREITDMLRSKGEVAPSQVPAALTARCSEVNRIVAELSGAYRGLESHFARGKSDDSLNYGVISRLFRRILYEQKQAFALDEAMTAKLRHGVRKAKFPVECVTAYGTRKTCIVAEDVQVAGLELGCDDVRRLFENLSGLKLSSPEFSIEGRRIGMILRTEKRFSIESSYKTSMISGESENGDTVSTFMGCDDRFYALISDGMGSGRDAAAASGLCSVFLEQLLAGGNDRETALELLNDFIRGREGECSTTVDLAEVDLITGEAIFSKSGAAPTFIRRAGDVFKIQSKTIPMGIARDTDVEHVRFPLKVGDSILMISDGVAAGFEESGWLLRLLGESWVDDPDEMCNRILNGARENNLRTDDMSVCILKVGEGAA
jgi:stage II sporulation protein E